jgi:hypothetical protein
MPMALMAITFTVAKAEGLLLAFAGLLTDFVLQWLFVICS